MYHRFTTNKDNALLLGIKQQPFHFVKPSVWPILTAFALFCLALGSVMLMHDYHYGGYVTSFAALLVLVCLYSWWQDVIKEGLVKAQHTESVRRGLRISMLLFILSEIMFFAVFFCSFLKSHLFPVGILDGVWVVRAGIWPPLFTETFDSFDIPLINTLILLLSSTTMTWAHYALKENNRQDCVTALGLTIMLGIFFSLMQAYEYYHATFRLKYGIYASNFYLATGFHGLHVIIGTIFLIICYLRTKRGDFNLANGYLSLELAAWYWYFIDIVWLFLFIFVYVCGS